MPFMQSPTGSPRSKALAQLTGSPPPPPMHSAAPGPTEPSITYIPPLIDGACGTTAAPTTQSRSPSQRLQHDVKLVARHLAALLWGAATARMDLAEVVQHVALAVVETYMLLALVPLAVMVPGAVALLWLAGCALLVVGMSWRLNGGGAVARGRVLRAVCPVAADGWMMGQEVEDERWIFVGGMGTR